MFEDKTVEDLTKYDGLDKMSLGTEITASSEHLAEYCDQVIEYYSVDWSRAVLQDPSGLKAKRTPEFQYRRTFWMVFLRYCMHLVMKRVAFEGDKRAFVPLLDLMLWVVKEHVLSMPAITYSLGSISWREDMNLPDVKHMSKLVYGKAALAVKLGTSDNLSRLNSHLIMSLSRLLYICALWEGSFVPAHLQFTALLDTALRSVWAQKTLFERKESIAPFLTSWRGRLAYLRALLCDLFPFLQYFDPVTPSSRPYIFSALYHNEILPIWQQALGPYRTQQIDEYFARETATITAYLNERRKQTEEFIAEVEAEFVKRDSKTEIISTAEPTIAFNDDEGDEELVEIEEGLKEVCLAQPQYSSSMEFAMRLIVAQYLHETDGDKEFWRERNEMVHPKEIKAIAFDGKLPKNLVKIMEEFSSLTRCPLAPSSWSQFGGPVKRQWATSAHVILQASHLCDIFDFSLLPLKQSHRLSVLCAHLKSIRAPYAHPNWRQFNLKSMLTYFGL